MASSVFIPIPTTYADSVPHYIYARLHNSKSLSQWPDHRTLFVVNLPPDATDREVIVFFKRYGLVERVVFDSDNAPQDQQLLSGIDDYDDGSTDSDDNPSPENENDIESTLPSSLPKKKKKKSTQPKVTPVIPLPPPSQPLRRLRPTGRTAHIVFVDPLPTPLSSSSKPIPWPHNAPNTSESPSGLQHYQALYQALRPPLDAVKAHVDSYILNYTETQKLAKQATSSKFKKGEAIVDEDGFTLVTRGGAYGQTLGGGVAVASKKFELEMAGGSSSAPNDEKRQRRKMKKERKKADMEEFYAFRKADKQRQEILDLKSRWEKDKASIEKKKAERRFKPY